VEFPRAVFLQRGVYRVHRALIIFVYNY